LALVKTENFAAGAVKHLPIPEKRTVVDALMRRVQRAKMSSARSSAGETKNMSEEQLHMGKIEELAGNNVMVNVCTCILKYSLLVGV
jgi:hypothetical protein